MTLLNCYNWYLWVLPPEKLPQYTSKRNPRDIPFENRESLFCSLNRFGQTVQRFDCIACHCL